MRFKNKTAALLPLLMIALVWAGCGEDALTPAGTTGYTADNPPPVLTSSSARTGALSPTAVGSGGSSWYTVAQGGVSYEGGEINGGRYELDFPAGAIPNGYKVLISVKEYDPDVLDIELGPHGIMFGEPVQLTIDYSGTNADPSSDNYDGSLPAMFWYNPDTGVWEELSGENELADREYTVALSHFSRYAVGGVRPPGDGTADW